MTSLPSEPFSLEGFLTQARSGDLLRFLTCGSVDDGKSTLIGRLLHDSGMVSDDQLQAVHRDSLRYGGRGGEIDFSLLVDGLASEREQGITIDVAYRYFSTPRRKFIIADTPGHEQYTRNMATGASTCDLAVILVDATRGVLDQTRRHAFIAALLGIRHLVLAVNKMDLVAWSEARFRQIREDFTAFAARLEIHDVHFLPISALLGDNVVRVSEQMPWHLGGPLLAYLESVHIAGDRNLIDLRLPVQLVRREAGGARRYDGTIASGVLRKGDEVIVLPAGTRSRIASLRILEGDAEQAFAQMPVTVTLTDELDVSRGDLFAHPNNVPRVEQELEAMLVWMAEPPLLPGQELLIKQTTVVVPAAVTQVRYRINVNTLHRETSAGLSLNEIGRVRIVTPRRLAFDAYAKNRATGAFILIDPMTNATVAAGMILDRDPVETVLVVPDPGPASPFGADSGEPSRAEWERRLGQEVLSIRLRGPEAAAVAAALRVRLFRRGFAFEVLDLLALRKTVNADLRHAELPGGAEEARRVEEIRRLLEGLAIGTILADECAGADLDVRIGEPSSERAVSLEGADPDLMAERLEQRLLEWGLPRAIG